MARKRQNKPILPRLDMPRMSDTYLIENVQPCPDCGALIHKRMLGEGLLNYVCPKCGNLSAGYVMLKTNPALKGGRITR